MPKDCSAIINLVLSVPCESARQRYRINIACGVPTLFSFKINIL